MTAEPRKDKTCPQQPAPATNSSSPPPALWRAKGVPLHIRTLRRLAKDHGTVPHPDEIAVGDLLRLLRPGDQLDCYTRTSIAAGLPAHASGVGANSSYSAHVAEIDSQWWYSAFNRGAAVGTHLAVTENDTVLAAMTDDDFEFSMDQACLDFALPGPQGAAAMAAFDALKFQYDDIRGIALQPNHSSGGPMASPIVGGRRGSRLNL
ncbi:hypothetical protein [Candidatus Poriferisocius sp.]|uniref:hypothetical protein n=1 Tax=Candidatus Poriferisocius sp. TaxID=3101276 RepID=UPI003B011886